jgi:hypothetical protein
MATRVGRESSEQSERAIDVIDGPNTEALSVRSIDVPRAVRRIWISLASLR